MKFPDKPIATGAMGIACALALLAFLSWPGLTNGITSMNPPLVTNVVTSNTESGVQYTSGAGLANSSVTQSSASSAGSSPENNSHIVPSMSSGITVSGSTVASVTTVAMETTTAVLPSVVSTASFPTTIAAAAQPVFAMENNANSRSSSNHASPYTILMILSISAAVIALGSMFFIAKRLSSNPPPPVEQEILN